jgi:hypothetical protein
MYWLDFKKEICKNPGDSALTIVKFAKKQILDVEETHVQKQ